MFRKSCRSDSCKDGVALITADHGNADEELTSEGEPMTAHTTNPVPFIVTKNDVELREDGILGDIAQQCLHFGVDNRKK